jgi:hypothetical protein
MLGAPQTPTQPQGSPPSDGGSKSYGKRELSTSKRAAQNRAAQVCIFDFIDMPLEPQLTITTARLPPTQGDIYPQA